jgi:hypothetical protein
VSRAKGLERAAATLSCFLALGTLLMLGLSEKGGAVVQVSRLPAGVLVGATVSIGALGTVAGAWALRTVRGDGAIQRQAVLGTAASVLLVAVAAVASAAGAASGRGEEADLRRATDAALRNSPGWNGGALVGRTSVFAFEVDPASDLANLLVRGYDHSYRLVLFGIDNRAGSSDVMLEVGGARLHHAGGATTTAARSGAVRVAAGDHLDGVTALFPPDESFVDMDWIEIRIDGDVRRVPGRYFTLAEKRKIEASRARGPQ